MLHPGGRREGALRHADVEGCAGVVYRSVGLHEDTAGKFAQWVPRPLVSLGTDGFGRSESRVALRDFFEVDAKHIVLATLGALAREKQIKPDLLQQAVKELGINPEKANPANT